MKFRLTIFFIFGLALAESTDICAKIYQLNKRMEPTSILIKEPKKQKYMRSPNSESVSVTQMAIAAESEVRAEAREREEKATKNKAFSFAKYPIFGRRARPRIKFSRDSLPLERSLEKPWLDFYKRIFQTEKERVINRQN